MHSRIANGRLSSSSRPDSILAKSSISSSSPSSDSLEPWIVSASSRCSSVSGVSSSALDSPITELIGVRISWLTVASTRLFARLATSAASRADSSSRSRASRRSSATSARRSARRHESSAPASAVEKIANIAIEKPGSPPPDAGYSQKNPIGAASAAASSAGPIPANQPVTSTAANSAM